MALVSDVKALLQDACERTPHYLVGAVLHKSKDPVDSWIVDVKDGGGEILLMLSEEGCRDRTRAMTAEQLHQAILALPFEDDVDVELCQCESEHMRLDSPIAAAEFSDDEEVLVFMDWDQAKRRGLCEGSLRLCLVCGQEKEGGNPFCLRCRAEFAERVEEASGGPGAFDIEAPGTGLPQAIVPFDSNQAVDHQRMTAELLGLPVEKTIDLGRGVILTMRLVPAGEFCKSGEFHFYRVKLTRPFYLGIYPVTQAQYEAIMGKNPSECKGPDLPVVTVTWDHAQRFCATLSRQAGQEFALPTGAQWEYACRAGTTSFFGFGDYEEDLSDYAWYHDNSDTLPPVGKKKPNVFGFYDMHGNVNEWCQDRMDADSFEDRYDICSGGLQVDPVGRTGPHRIIYGGTWLSGASDCGSASRGLTSPKNTSCILGFRVAAALPIGA